MRKGFGAAALVALALSVARGGDTREACDYAIDSNNVLYEIDCERLTWKRVGPIRVPLRDGIEEMPDLWDIAATPDGFLYGVGDSGLYLINFEDPSKSERIGAHGLVRAYGMSVGIKGGLYVHTLRGDLHKVDRKTAAATLVGRLGKGMVASGDIAVVQTRVPGGKVEDVLVCSVKDDAGREGIATIDPETGAGTFRGRTVDENGLAVSNIFGLIFRREVLYGLTNEGDIVSIDPFSGQCRRLKRSSLIWWGATEYNRF